MTEERHVSWGADQLASERTLLAAERTFSAWIRTGLAAIGGGLAVARVLVFKSPAHELLAHSIGGLLVVWGASVFIHAILSYHHTCKRLSQEGLSRTSLGAMKTMTANPVGHRRAGAVDHASMNDYRTQSPASSALRLYGTDRARTCYREESGS